MSARARTPTGCSVGPAATACSGAGVTIGSAVDAASTSAAAVPGWTRSAAASA